MKKLLAILLALCVVGGFAFAAPVVAISLDGTVTVVNQDLQGKLKWDDSYLSFSATDDKAMYGISFAVGNDKANALATEGLYFNGWKAWGYLFDKKVKLTVGKISTDAYTQYSEYQGNYLWTVGPGADAVQVNALVVSGLDCGVIVPYSTTATDVVDIFSNTHAFVKYSIDKVGTLKAVAKFAAWKPVIGAAFEYTGVENLTAAVQGSFDLTGTAAAIAANASAIYVVGDITAELEFDSTVTPTFGGTVYVGANWTKDALSADVDTSITVAPAVAWGGVTADVWYTLGSNFKAGVLLGYDGTDFTASLPLTFDFAF